MLEINFAGSYNQGGSIEGFSSIKFARKFLSLTLLYIRLWWVLRCFTVHFYGQKYFGNTPSRLWWRFEGDPCKNLVISNKKIFGQKIVVLVTHSEGCDMAKYSLYSIFKHFESNWLKYEQKPKIYIVKPWKSHYGPKFQKDLYL